MKKIYAESGKLGKHSLPYKNPALERHIENQNLERKTILTKIDEKTPINNLKEIKYT